MKKLLFSIVLLLLSYVGAKAQPYLTFNNNTSTCTFTVQGRAADALCSNSVFYLNMSLGSGTTVVNLQTLCVTCTSGYTWVSGRVGDGCINSVSVGDGPCNSFNLSEPLTVASCGGTCGSVTVDYIPGTGGDATIDIN